jgi:hypothetical protein
MPVAIHCEPGSEPHSPILDPRPKRRLDRGMKAILLSLFVALLMVGCMRDRITDYYDNGQKKWERHWKGQELDGPVTWWYENGQKRQQINYKDGKKDGPFIVWNEKGKEIRRENYKDGELVKD